MRDQNRPRDNRPANGTYRDRVAGSPLTPEVARARFSAWVERALEGARAQGLTDREIQRISGVSTSTFHRWRLAGIKGLPKMPQVRAFAAATGARVEDAMKALGMTDADPEPTPEPPLPRDVVTIMRRLSDPNTPESEREFIRMTLQMLAERAGGRRRDSGQAAG
jgi:hypothetical protein